MHDASAGAALRAALCPSMARRSLIVAAIVGTLLNVINQGDALLAGDAVNGLKVALTYAVPFCVATYGAYSASRVAASQA